MAHDLAGYQPHAAPADATLLPLAAGQEPQLLAFLDAAFPGRWAWECREFWRVGGRASDFLALWREDKIIGFCQTTLADSARPIERFFMAELPRPWGQLGPLGVSKALRGHGYGAAVIDGALQHLARQGVRGAVIDWTSLLDLYAKFGFRPFHSYTVLSKDLHA